MLDLDGAEQDKLLTGTLLHLAVVTNDARLVQALLDAGIDAEPRGTVQLHHGFDFDGGFLHEQWTAEDMANSLDYVEVSLAIGRHIHNSGGARNAEADAEVARRKHGRRRRGEKDNKRRVRRAGKSKAKSPGAAAAAAAAPDVPPGPDDQDVCEAEGAPSSVVYRPGDAAAAAARAPSPIAGALRAPHRWRDIDPSEIELHDVFDSGGFGVIYHGLYQGEEVAVKLMPLPADLLEDALLRKQFFKEMQALSAANESSDRVCKLYGASVKNGRLCLVMKLYSGCLHDVIEQAPGHRMRTCDIVPALMDIALGLRDMHASGIVLRDLKPANCLVDSEAQRVVLADFGLARKVRDTHTRRLATTTNMAGTPNYSAPECFADETAHLTAAVDIWSFAACAVHMFAGEPPMIDKTIFQIATKLTVRREHPPIPERAPPILQALLVRCFAFEPSERPSADELVAQLQRVIDAGGY